MRFFKLFQIVALAFTITTRNVKHVNQMHLNRNSMLKSQMQILSNKSRCKIENKFIVENSVVYQILSEGNLMLYAIWYHFYSLKNAKNTHESPPWVFFMFFKLYK